MLARRLRPLKRLRKLAGLFRRPLPPFPWYDLPGADERITAGWDGAQLTEDDRQLLRGWRKNGFLKLEGVVPTESIERMRRDIDAAWSGGKNKFWVEHYDDENVMVDPLQPGWRAEPHKLLDVHCSSQAAQDVLAAPKLKRWLHLLLGDQVLAFQSLVFERGTMQGLHRDTNFVGVVPAWQMIAIWIALEDIQPGTGELEYYAGSHRLKDYVFPSGDHYLLPGETLPTGYSQYYEDLAEAQGLERQSFLPKRGDVFIWHGGLVHGGRDNISPGSTRHSFVTHLCPKGGIPDYARGGEWGPCHGIGPDLATGSAWRGAMDGPINRVGPKFPRK